MELIGRRAILFTDIEGSTALFKSVGDAYGDLLDSHHRILRTAIRDRGGFEVVSEGDSFVATFDSIDAAISTAVDAQLELLAHEWPADRPLRVRMGLHVGDIARSESGLIGMALHETARIAAAAHGSQILVSAEVADHVAHDVADDVADDATDRDHALTVRHLGLYELKDLGQVPLIQLLHSQLPAEFPPPRADGLGHSNLPAQLDTLVGRDAERAEIASLLTGHRLVTLVGAGGVGKTKLALAVAADNFSVYPGGVWLVELAEETDDVDVLGSIASTIGVGPTADDVIGHLRDRSTLVVLDNCEHLLGPAAAAVATLTSGCPSLHVLATSQEPLDLAGELAWRVPSLLTDDAVELFRQRARSGAGLTDDEETERLIASICTRLDGIPLAIELAAARCRTMSVDDIHERLADRFQLLTVSHTDALARHQTLLATVDWSFALLGNQERQLAARLAVFRGGADLAAIEQVCADDDVPKADIVDLIDALSAKSIVDVRIDRSTRRTRVTFPETIRQYAAQRLAEAGEDELMAERHAAHFVDVAALAERGWRSKESSLWTRRCSLDAENLAAASDWLEVHDPERAARMLGDLHIWMTADDGAAFLGRIGRLSERDDISPSCQADIAALRALLAEGYGREGVEVGAKYAQRAVALLHHVADSSRRLRVLAHAAIGLRAHDLPLATKLSERALEEARELGDWAATSAAMYDLILLRPEDHPETRALRRELIENFDAENPPVWAVGLLVDEALDVHHHGEHRVAMDLLDDAERILAGFDDREAAVDPEAVAFTVWSTLIRAEQGDVESAVLLSADTIARLSSESAHLRKVLHSTRGHALMIAGRIDEARRSFEIAIDRTDGWRYLVYAIAQVGLASLDVDAGRYAAARERLRTVIDDADRQRWLRARALDVLARAALATGAPDQAAEHVAAADELYAAGGYVVPPALRDAHDELREQIAARSDGSPADHSVEMR